MTKRLTPISVDPEKYDPFIKSGDFLGVMRFDGLDPMLAWAMGSQTGHTVVAMRDEKGELWICESTTKSKYWPTDYVQYTPFVTNIRLIHMMCKKKNGTKVIIFRKMNLFQ